MKAFIGRALIHFGGWFCVRGLRLCGWAYVVVRTPECAARQERAMREAEQFARRFVDKAMHSYKPGQDGCECSICKPQEKAAKWN